MHPFPPMLGAVGAAPDISLAWVFPFALLLGLIAVMPLVAKHWWEKYYPVVSVGLGLLVAAPYFLHPGGAAVVVGALREYFSFIVLIAALYVVAAGIHIEVKGAATPLVNVAFLAVGTVLAALIGTTGASIVLIRPWIRMNKIRVGGHHVVFFIFLVSNIGGITPMGPPLFLGYLAGVPFFWPVEHVLAPWVATVALVLAAFYFFDRRSFHRLPQKLGRQIEAGTETWQFDGAANSLLLLALLGCVYLPDAWFPTREVAMLAIAGASYLLTKPAVRAKNTFHFGPVKEVAYLFAGIFLTMMPALGYLAAHGPEFNFTHPMHYYLASGALSSVLDNAPTYLNFLQLAQSTATNINPAAFAGASGAAAVQVLLVQQPHLVIGTSLGSVYFGAMTYIGNGPNFMVKAIAHDAGVHCPTFHRYITHYSLPVLLPILIIVGWLFL